MPALRQRHRRRLCPVSLLLLAGLAPAMAASLDEHVAGFDLDGDGRVDRGEFEAYFLRGFDARDRNGNGVLDLDEQPRGHARRPLSRDQQRLAYAAAFLRQDVNGDGVLDAAELTAPPR